MLEERMQLFVSWHRAWHRDSILYLNKWMKETHLRSHVLSQISWIWRHGQRRQCPQSLQLWSVEAFMDSMRIKRSLSTWSSLFGSWLRKKFNDLSPSTPSLWYALNTMPTMLYRAIEHGHENKTMSHGVKLLGFAICDEFHRHQLSAK